MPLPSSRDTNYAVGADIKSADLNTIQDCIIAGKHGALVKVLDAADFEPGAVGTATLTQGTGGGWEYSAGTPAVYAGLSLVEGDRIDAVDVYGYEDGSSSYTAKLYIRDLTDGSMTQIGGTKTSGTTGAWTTVGWTSADSGIPKTVGVGESIVLEVTLSGANVKLAGAKVTHVKP